MRKTDVKYTGARLQKHNFQSHVETQKRRLLYPVTVYVTLREQCTKIFFYLYYKQQMHSQYHESVYHSSVSLHNPHSYLFRHFHVIIREFHICALLSYINIIILLIMYKYYNIIIKRFKITVQNIIKTRLRRSADVRQKPKLFKNKRTKTIPNTTTEHSRSEA
jgi:hypothetical protein